MADVIGEAYVRVRPETAGFQQEAQPGLFGAAKKLAVGIAGIFAAQKVFTFGKDAINEAALTQKATENINVQFGKAAKGVLSFSDTAAKSFGISKTDAEQFASQIGLVTKNLGIGKDKGAEMAVGLQKLAGSVGLIKGQDPSAFFQKLQQALLGNTRGLKQMGIAVDSTSESQFALNHHLITAVVNHAQVQSALQKSQAAQKAYTDAVKKGNTSQVDLASLKTKAQLAEQGYQKALAGTAPKLTAAQKAQAIYGLATQHLSGFIEQAKGHSNDWADTQIRLRAELSNVQEEIGAALLPVMAALGKVTLDVIIPAIGGAVDAMKALVSAIPIDVLKGLALGIAVAGAAWIAYTAISYAVTTAQYAVATAQGVLNAVMDANPIALVVIGIAAFVAALYILYNRVQVVHDAVQAVFGFLKTYVPVALADTRAAITTFVDVVKALWDRFGGTIMTVIRTDFGIVKAIVMADLQVIKDVIKLALDIIHGHWGAVWGDLKHLVSDALNGVVSITLSILHGLASTAGAAARAVGTAIIHAITGAITGFGHLLYNAGAALIQGLINGIESKVSAVGDAISGIASSITSHFPNSPIAKTGPLHDFTPQKMGAGIVGALAEGIGIGTPRLRESVRALAGVMAASNLVPAVAGGATPAAQRRGGLLSAVAPAGGGGIAGREDQFPLSALTRTLADVGKAVRDKRDVTITNAHFTTNAMSFDALRKDALDRAALRVRK